MEEPRQLALVSQARMALAEARTIDEVKDIRDKAEAMRLYLRQRDESLEAQNTAAEIKLWAERKAGELLKEMPKHPAGRPPMNRSNDTTDYPPTLADMGISKDESSRFQTIASIPEPLFTQHIEETKAAEIPLTTAGVMRQARSNGNEQTQARPEKSQAERHREHFLECLDDIDDLTRAVAAKVEQGGYGGFQAVLEKLSGRERLRVRGTVETMIERLQGWLPYFPEFPDEQDSE